MQFKLEIRGLNTAVKRLEYGRKKVTHNIQRSLELVGKLVKNDAIRKAPKKSGALEQSITYKTGRNYVDIKVPKNSPAGAYALIRHYGYYNLGEGSKSKGADVGRLYIKRAITDNISGIRNIFRTVFKDI